MKYSVPHIPKTPSSRINNLLETRFGQPPDNVVKSLAAHYICAVFYSINALYEVLSQSRFFVQTRTENTKSFDGHYRAWLVACTLVPLFLVLSCYFLYKIILACSYLADMALAYGLASFAWIALAAGIFGAMLYDRKKTEKQDSGNQSASEKNLGYDSVTKTSFVKKG